MLKTIARTIAAAKNKKYAEVMQDVRTRLAFTIVRSTHLCIRGSRKRWRVGHFERCVFNEANETIENDSAMNDGGVNVAEVE